MERPAYLGHETAEGDFGILADLEGVAVGITLVAAPFPSVIV
jgi:hypothetical protein